LLVRLWSIRTDHWSESFVGATVTIRLNSGACERLFVSGTNCEYTFANCEMRLPGMTLPGNGCFVFGSRTAAHWARRGLGTQKGELVGKTPVLAELSARLPANCALEGKRPRKVDDRRSRNISPLLKKKSLLRTMGPPRDAPKSL